MGKSLATQLQEIDEKITEARKSGNKKKMSELRIKHRELSHAIGQGVVKTLTAKDKKPAKKDDTGPPPEETDVSKINTNDSKTD